MELTVIISVILANFALSTQDLVIVPPENVTIHSQDDSVFVRSGFPQIIQNSTITVLNEKCFNMELQFKSSTAMQWEKPLLSTGCSGSKTFLCQFNNANLDPEKCYLIQIRFIAIWQCVSNHRESKWGTSILLKNGKVLGKIHASDSCDEEIISKRLLILLSTSLFIIILFVCVMKRLIRFVFPVIPDAKRRFSGLFEDHEGNFQDWMIISGNETKQEKVESVENECIIEEECAEEMHMETVESDALPEEQTATGTMSSEFCFKKDGPDVCVGNFTYTMNDSMYIKL